MFLCLDTFHPDVAGVFLPLCGLLKVPARALAAQSWIIDTSFFTAYTFNISNFHLPFSSENCVGCFLQIEMIDNVQTGNGNLNGETVEKRADKQRFCGRRLPWSVSTKGKGKTR